MRQDLCQRLMFPVGLALAAMLLLFVGLTQATGPDDLGQTGITADLHTASPAVSAEQAVALAINDLAATGDGYEVHHPRHDATFTPAGLTFTPRRGGPAWSWRLIGANSGHIDLGAIAPRNTAPGTVAYPRGGLVEQYLLQADGVEQQFIIPAPLALDGTDLVIEGAVSSEGVFETASGGWLWRTAKGVVSLGDVYVFDAAGRELPATMDVTADETHIVVDGTALAQAAYPVTVDPQIGSNDFRISDMGSDGDTDYDALDPDVAYNNTNNEYLVVWSGDDITGSLSNDEFEIFGQRINAATGAEVGADFRISDMGPDGNADCDANSPQVAYNSGANEYLVVWSGDDVSGLQLNDEYEIYGQRINAATGAEVGNNDFRISDMGPDGNDAYDALYPIIAYNNLNEEYLVVWYGDDDTNFGSGSLADNETEVFGQRIHGDRTEGDEVTGETDFRISDMGPDGDDAYDAQSPQVAYNSTNNEYLVVWYGDDNTSPLVDNETEIYGQRIYGNHTSGDDVGDNDFRISDMGDDTIITATIRDDYNAGSPGVAYNSTNNEYLVVWHGDDDTPPLVDGETDIFGQRINAATGDQVGNNDFRISDMGTDGDTNYDAGGPKVAYNRTNNEYLVVWVGDDDTFPLVNGETEVFGQRIYGDRASGDELGSNDFRLSDMGPNGDVEYGMRSLGVAYASTANEYLAVWSGDDDTSPLVNDEFEIFGQRWELPTEPNLSIVKTVAPPIAGPGQTITYALNIANIGTAMATNVFVTDSVPVSVTHNSLQFASSLNITATGSISYVWQVQNLAPGQGGSITITGQISASLPQNHISFTNTARITTTAVITDSDPKNNSSAAAVTVTHFSEAVDTPLLGIQLGSAAWGDYDNDGDLDIFSTGRESTADPYVTKIYRNDGSDVFVTAVDTMSGTQYYNNAEPWGDYDNDGDLDILVAGNGDTAASHIARVYRNDGSDTFTATVTETTLLGFQRGASVWGDYDNDGDLDIFITGYVPGGKLYAMVYRNDGADTFTESVTDPLLGVAYAAAAWGDYDNDGDLDLFLTGYDEETSKPIARVYRNDGADTFVAIAASFIGVQHGSVAWGDYDNDGDLDILVAGWNDSEGYTATVYRNEGADTFVKAVSDPLAGVQGGSVDWGDYDNDGDLDILLTGWDSTPAPITKIYRNDGSDTFVEVNADPLENIADGAAVWGDYDNDGDLDIFLTGHIGGGNVIAKIYRNNIGVYNTVPDAPGDLSAQVSGTEVELGWAAPPAGSTTPGKGLTYNLYVGASPSKVDVVSPHAFTTTNPLTNGLRLLPALGYAQHGLTATLTLTDGLYYWSVQAVDHTFAGSPFATEGQFIIDTQPPDAPVLISPADNTPISDTTPTLDWNVVTDNGPAGVAGYNVQVDTTNVYTVTAPSTQYTLTVLADGAHTWTVRAYDAVGNYGPYTDTWSFTVDTTPPDIPTLVSPADGTVTNTTELTLTWGAVAGAAGYLLDFDGTTSDVGNVTESSTGVLVDGTYTWTIASYDTLHNASAFTDVWSFVVDTTPPDTSIIAQPPNPDNNSTPTFEFTGDDLGGSGVASFECQLDGGGWGTCTSPHTTASLTDGPHTFEVRAIDNLGHTDVTPAGYTWTVDTSLLDAPVLISPANGTLTDTASLTLTWGTVAGAAGYLLDFDGTVVDVGNVTFSATGVLADGTYTWTVVAYDVFSSTGIYTDVWSFTVDTTPPDTSITAQPPNPDNNSTPTFEFTGDDLGGSGVASFECQLDGGGWGTCTSPHTTASLTDGPHTFEVRAIDNLGHTDVTPASYTWTVDATAPSITDVNPADGATGVPRNASIIVDFDEAMNTGSVSYLITPTVILTPTWYNGGTRLTLTHDEFAANTSYTVTVGGGSDLIGNPLSNAPYTWVFTTSHVSVPEADLALGKVRAGTGDVIAGECITYTFTVTNAGPTTPVTVTIVDSFAPTDTLTGVSGEGCAWSGAEVVTCTVTNITTVNPHILTLVVTTSNTYSGTVSNIASVAPVDQVIDPNLDNNDAGPVIVTIISTGTGDRYIYLPLVLRNS